MRCPILAARVFVLLLVTVAGSAFAQPPPPPFTISFASAQLTAPESSTVQVVLKCTGTAPANLQVGVSSTYFNFPSGSGYGYSFLWGAPGAPEHVLTFNFADNYYDPGRSVVFTITSVSNGGAIGTPASMTLNIVDDEKQPVLSISDVTIDEGTAGPGIPTNIARFTVSLSSALATPTFIPAVVHDQTAKNGLDFLWTNGGGVVFDAGQQSTTLSIPIVGDKLPEGDETFTVELFPPYPILAGKTIGVCTILDDDGAVSPQSQRIAVGDNGVINVQLTDPAASDEKVILGTSDATLLSVPSFVTIPAGSSEAQAEFTGLRVGAGSILATLPPSRGGRTYELSVTVHDSTTLTIDPIQLDISLGMSADVTARVNPVPAAPVRLLVQAVKSGIVDIPDVIPTGADGSVVIPVRSTGLGSTTVNIALLDIEGGASAILGVNVTLGLGPFVTNVVPELGRVSGGQSVRLDGYNFSDHCAFSFGGAPVPDGSPQPGGNTIFLVTPPHDAGIVDISVRCGTRSFVLAGGFTYQPAPLKVTDISPKSGTTRGGTLVGIIGTDLWFDSCSARFGQTQASPVSTNGNTSNISVMSPPHAVGSVDVSLVCGSETVTLPGAFSYVSTDDPPASSLSTYGLKQGTLTEISGFLLRRDDEVLVNGVVLQDMTTPEPDLHLVTLPEIAGQAQLTLRDYIGRTLTSTVTIAPPDMPVVTQLPDRITLGAEFSVSGTGLRRGLTYMLGPAPVQVIPNPVSNAFTDRSLCDSCVSARVFRAPVSVGPGTVSFTIADHGTVVVTKSVELTTSGLGASAITPPCAAFDGGSLITISGSGFEEGAAVQFGTTYSIDVVVKDPFTIIARLPPSYGIAQPQITVFNPDGGAATLTNAFSYQSSADPGCGNGGGRHRATAH
ncbi:MAG TPA: IPT/TIG domain-containing protein [Thermoanaerobaculia bacterium]|jgi:hypothetical protein|nr:IPT/TIG domain-containing protein [Thermoanaerobaculia bacterium]